MYYSFDCGDCHDCFGCANLGNKSYCIFNVQHTKEEYEAKLPELKKMPMEDAVKKVKAIQNSFPLRQSNFFDNNNSDYVDYVYHTNNSYYCFDCNRLDSCFYTYNSNENKDTFDVSYSFRDQNSAELIDTKECYNCLYVEKSARCYDSFFLYDCRDCHNCFGCAKLNNKEYCILNVQYTEEEYNKKIAEVKKELGLYFQEPEAKAAVPA
jgi:hypothetical protein